MPMLNVNIIVKQKYGRLLKFLQEYGMEYGTWNYKVRTGGFSFLEMKKLLVMLDVKFEDLEFIESVNQGEASKKRDKKPFIATTVEDFASEEELIDQAKKVFKKSGKKLISEPMISGKSFSGSSPLDALRALKQIEE